MNITLITPTCDRPETFALTELWMRRQTIPIYQWIVLDDGKIPAICSMGQTHIYYNSTYGPQSLSKKINLFLKKDKNIISGEAVAFIEDDDWYSSFFLEKAISFIKDFDMAGEGYAIYYNVRNRTWHNHHNRFHCSLAQTIIKTKKLNLIEKISANGNPFIDLGLWKEKINKKIYLPTASNRTMVGIKGIYSGYSAGHAKPLPVKDQSMRMLKSLIGNDISFYKDYYVDNVKINEDQEGKLNL